MNYFNLIGEREGRVLSLRCYLGKGKAWWAVTGGGEGGGKSLRDLNLREEGR